MAFYRLQFISDLKTGAVGHTYDFDAQDDAAAIAFAGLWVDHAPMELWRDSKLLKRWKRAND